MIIARSLAFNVAFYVVTLLEMIVFSPVYFIMPRKKAWFVPKFWAHTNLFLQKWLAGTDKQVEGLENLPEGSYIVAPKHQSSWDTYALLPHIPDGLLILKRELMWIPIFGWYVAKMRMIPIDRGARGKVLKDVVRLTRERMQEGRQLIIYPEGTRRAPGEAPAYKWGIAEIYSQLGVPVVPIAHVAGLYWPRSSPAWGRKSSWKGSSARPRLPATNSSWRPRSRTTPRPCRRRRAGALPNWVSNHPGPPDEPQRRRMWVATLSSQWSRMPSAFRWSTVLSTYSSFWPERPTAPITLCAASAGSTLPAY
jgi:1-acyl-sn-glycerol-3-phosphate acyltransferase